MCIIAAKSAGVKMPDSETVSRMFYFNPNGAGFMYAVDGMVHIRKGYMTLAGFENALTKLGEKYDLDSIPLVMHFRITTHGGTSPENTHPFPVSNSLQNLRKTSNSAKVAIAHNGVIHNNPRKGISDTMEYVLSRLAPLSEEFPQWYHDRQALKTVEHEITSKMAILTGDGEIVTIGKFFKNNGILYSKKSYANW